MSIRSLAVMGALLRLRHNSGSSWECDWCWTACLTTVATSHARFDRHNRGTGELVTTRNHPGVTGTRLVMMAALDWLGYASLPKLDYQSESLVNEIYRGEDSIVRHWLKAPWNMDGWRLDVNCICWGSRWGAQ